MIKKKLSEQKKVKLGIAIVNNMTMKNFNKKFHQSDRETDVLSFEVNEEFPEGFFFLGDVLVSFDQIRKQAKEYNCSEAEELARVVAHGVLHLMGYRDGNEEEKKEMRKMEENTLKRIFKFKR